MTQPFVAELPHRIHSSVATPLASLEGLLTQEYGPLQEAKNLLGDAQHLLTTTGRTRTTQEYFQKAAVRFRELRSMADSSDELDASFFGDAGDAEAGVAQSTGLSADVRELGFLSAIHNYGIARELTGPGNEESDTYRARQHALCMALGRTVEARAYEPPAESSVMVTQSEELAVAARPSLSERMSAWVDSARIRRMQPKTDERTLGHSRRQGQTSRGAGRLAIHHP